MIRSVRPNNILTMLSVAKDEFPLTKFLVRQVLQSHEDRIETLRDFVPTARPEDWELIHAGQRVQTMKRVKGLRGGLVFGTEVVTGADGTIAALLGASPGASVSPSIMLEVMQRCFPDDYRGWESRLREMIPSLGLTLANEPRLYHEIQAFTTRTLGLDGAPGPSSVDAVLVPASAR
jgi:malate dehydrogenase (quinone)